MDLVRVNKQWPTGKAARTPESRAPVISGKIAAEDGFRPPDDVTGTIYTATIRNYRIVATVKPQGAIL